MNIYEKLISKVNEYNSTELNKVIKAYEFAKNLHEGQFRQSGEPYIDHPTTVAYILADMYADCNTLCAALLHDTLEDTSVTKDVISDKFNSDVANLVDGVTKISKLNFSNKQEQNMANTRKIITGITNDVRIIIIKLADRLHNMRTLQFKSPLKQKENALETMEIFAPLSYYIGAYRVKSELEDLSLMYLYPDKYKEISEIKKKLEDESKSCLCEMHDKIKSRLKYSHISNEIKIRTKNIYGIYKKLESGNKLCDVHDLLALKIMVNGIEECYKTLCIVHNEYHPINDKFKDYICNPKTNMYQSLHTTVFGPEDKLVQTQIRTFDMDKIASFGLTSYWDMNKGLARERMQEDLRDKFQFFSSLVEINNIFSDNQEFVYQVKNELFGDKVYVYTPKGDIIELPKGSTPIDYAYKINTNIGNTMVYAIVNDKKVDDSYKLRNKDRIRIVTDDLTYGSRDEWYDIARTSHAKMKIKEFKGR